jgi:Flp pilus assembly protein TadG
MKKQIRFGLLRGEHGASLVEMAFVLPLFLILAFGAVDFGRALYLSMEIAGAADAAAAYGSLHPSDTTGMKTAAQDDAPNVTNLSVATPTYGCECPTDTTGSTYSANCATQPTCSGGNTFVLRVNVTVTGTYTPLFPWPGIPSSIAFSSSASTRSAGG